MSNSLIDKFWLLDNKQQFSSNETRMFFHLLRLYNLLETNSFECSDKIMCSIIDCSYEEMISCKNNLQTKGVIEFSESKYSLSIQEQSVELKKEPIYEELKEPVLFPVFINTQYSKIGTLDLSDSEIIGAMGYVYRTAQIKFTQDEVLDFLAAFNIQYCEETYTSRSKKVQHFNNWLKSQKSNNGKQSIGTSAARVDKLKNW